MVILAYVYMFIFGLCLYLNIFLVLLSILFSSALCRTILKVGRLFIVRTNLIIFQSVKFEIELEEK